MSENSTPLSLGERITLLPVIHGSAESALAVRRWLLEHSPDCLAVPLPASLGPLVEQAVQWLPTPSIVVQKPYSQFNSWSSEYSPDGEERDQDDDDLDDFDGEDLDDDDEDEMPWAYVPIDPCQSVIMAIRTALGEHIPIEFIDRESNIHNIPSNPLPDPFALKTVSLEKFATAILPGITRPETDEEIFSIQFMASQLKRLEKRYKRIAMICSVNQWPWIREAYREPPSEIPENEIVEDPLLYGVDPRSLTFLFGELPFITSLYEKARSELEDDENLSIDGVKQLLMAARSAYYDDFGKRSRKITPMHLSQCLKFIRNMTLLDRRMTPDLYTIATAGRGVVGDQYTIHLVETANTYDAAEPLGLEQVKMGIEQARLPNGDLVELVNLLPGNPMIWRPLELKRKPEKIESDQWKSRWDPRGQCSWPPEDESIESFRTRVFDRARAIMGADLARSEKFSTSFKDGIDIRETLRHWYDGEIYVKVLPPSVGMLDAAVMLFDSPADPRDYPWRTTWFAEHNEESTLAFYATHFGQELVGPGVAMATYGGVLFLFPPRPIPDIWTNRKLDFCETMEERLIAAACRYAESSQIAILSWLPPGAGWRRLAKRFHKTLVHVPMAQFSSEMIQQLRTFHVLNGQHVRSYASHFIRKA